MNEQDKTTVLDIVQKHVRSEMFNFSNVNDMVSVQFHDIPDSFGDICHELTEESFTYHVDSVSEAPPKILIKNRSGYIE